MGKHIEKKRKSGRIGKGKSDRFNQVRWQEVSPATGRKEFKMMAILCQVNIFACFFA